MSRPEQAVILCGGLGMRLRPITDNLPKPMAPVNGRPFLAYLLQQLKEQGIERILMLTGYRGEMIHEFFGNGESFGVDICYSHGPVEWETGRRIFEARTELDSAFLLLYSDNYVPVNLEELYAFHAAHGTVVSLVVQPKASANIRLMENGLVDLYDPTRTELGLKFVEIGYMVVQRDRLLPFMDEPDASFSQSLSRLATQQQLAGLVSRDPYHSIADVDRLQLTRRYLANKRILMIDRDGTINARPPRAEYVTRWKQFHWVDETVDSMQQLATQGFRFIVVSNQAGIARGMIDASALEAVNARMCDELQTCGVDIISVYVCPHHWDAGCDCRKPAPGMFFRASEEHQLRMNRTIYVGDDPRDSLAAHNANCPSILIGPERHSVANGAAKPERVAETLLELVPWIVSRFEEWESVP
ncbi:MAG: HAD-IIIA family hydrolase [Chloroflexota bacterium]|nr:HAD-IIIA family hydrolase [Chloroflexota bacterium]